MILRVTSYEWANLSESLHQAMFKKHRPREMDRIDYAFLVDLDDTIAGYVTVQEIDAETVYWQFGGAFEWTRNRPMVVRGYDEVLKRQSEYAKCILTKVKSTNYPMLKLHLSRGFLIYGVQVWNGETLVELKKEFEDGDRKNICEHVEPKARSEEAA